jgi:hypothetical protein
MKSIVMAVLLLLLASAAFGQVNPIYDIQTGVFSEGSLLTPRGVVTGVGPDGFFVAEAPYNEYRGLWVYTGTNPPVYPGTIPAVPIAVGDDVQLCGVYEESYGLTQLNIPAAGWYGDVQWMGTLPVPEPNVVTAADIFVDPALAEPWESCIITIQDGMTDPTVPDGNGEWYATALDLTTVMFDDYWYDTSQVDPVQCYNNATGILNYTTGNFKLEVFADGIPIVGCTVEGEAMSFGALKALYR